MKTSSLLLVPFVITFSAYALGCGGSGTAVTSSGTSGPGGAAMSSASTSTGAGGSAGAATVVLSTCGECAGGTPVAPYDGDKGTGFFEAGDWAGVRLSHNKPVDTKTVSVEFAAGPGCGSIDTGVEMTVVPLSSQLPDPNSSAGWGISLAVPGTSSTWTQNLSPVHVLTSEELVVTVQMQVQTFAERTCIIVYDTSDPDTAKDLWFHHEAACDNGGQPAEDCGWKDLAVSPTPKLGIPGHWGIVVNAVEAP